MSESANRAALALLAAEDRQEIRETSTSLILTFLEVDLFTTPAEAMAEKLPDLLETRDWFEASLSADRPLCETSFVYGNCICRMKYAAGLGLLWTYHQRTRPVAAIDQAFPKLRRPLVHRAAFYQLKRRSAGRRRYRSTWRERQPWLNFALSAQHYLTIITQALIIRMIALKKLLPIAHFECLQSANWCSGRATLDAYEHL
jgi:hypothetical protein